MKKTLQFKTNTLLKNLVGKDLINDDNIAIVELVKNSYDANSEKVLVIFDDFSSEGVSITSSQIIIADEGVGMDLEDIEDKWLNIAYSEKFLLEQEHGRYLAGNKGIGRFSCDRLGKELDLITRKKGSELLHLKIQWADFEREGEKDLTIQDIDLEIVSIDEKKANQLSGLTKFPDTGTILVISSLRSEWKRTKLRKLKTSLEKFLNPNQLFLREKFIINLSVPALEAEDSQREYSDRINGEIENQIFQKLRFKTTYIETTISENGGIITTVLYHDGEKVFDLVEKNKSYPLLKKTHLVIYYLNRYKKAYFKRQTGVHSVKFGSIFLFLNGFRVSPYGDYGNDWLGLETRKSQGYARYLGTRDIIGRIEISGSEQNFKPISSREGLKNTDALTQLRENFYIDAHRKLEKFVVGGLGWDSVSIQHRDKLASAINEGLDWKKTTEQYSESWELKKQRIALLIMSLIGASPEHTIKFWFNPSLLEDIYETRQKEVEKILEDIEDFDTDKIDTNLSRNLSKFKRLIKRKEEEAKIAKKEASDLRIEVIEKEEEIGELEKEKEVYRSQTLFLQQVVSLDVKQLTLYHHEIKLQSHFIDNHLGRVIKDIKNLPNNKKMLNNLEGISLANKKMASIAQYATKANFQAGTEKQPTDIPAYIEQYVLRVARDFNSSDLKLEVENSVNELFEVNVSRIELSILLDNIISNSSKALAKKLVISISKISKNTIRISFVDNGEGLDKKLPNTDSIFEIGVTTTIGGSGLGLYHVKNIVEKLNGKIEAIPITPRGMEIRIEVMR